MDGVLVGVRNTLTGVIYVCLKSTTLTYTKKIAERAQFSAPSSLERRLICLRKGLSTKKPLSNCFYLICSVIKINPASFLHNTRQSLSREPFPGGKC